MSYLNDIYYKRLNRYGTDYKSRVQNQREREFEDLLNKSVYRVDFEYNGNMEPGILNRYKQDETQTLQYLFTRNNLIINSGTILNLVDSHNEIKPWMMYWLEEKPAGGYNRYIMLKMTHEIKWTARDGQKYTTLAYMYGQEDNMLRDELKSRSRMDTLYNENLKESFFVCPTNPNIQKEDYFEIGEGNLLQGYVVTGFDVISTPGVEYVTVDPVYNRDHTPAPVPESGQYDGEYFWLQGGAK